MAGNETKLQIVIDAENRTAGAFNSMSSSLEGIASTMKTVGAIGAVGFAATTAAVYKSVEAAADAAKVDAQLEAVLRSTSNAAGLFTEDLQDQAVALQKLTTFDDEAIKSAEALLLTFTNVKGPVFQGAIGTILDMSVALGQDLKSSSIQVGKALNDPILGITALSRVGVSFTEDQKAVIQALVDTGQTAQAQQVILAELNKEFGGSAQAQAQTYAGQVAQLKNRFGDLQEEIGGQIIPILASLLERIAPLIERTLEWTEAHPKLTQAIILGTLAFTALLAVLLPIGIALPGIVMAIGFMGAAMAAISVPALVAIASIAAVTAALGYMASQGYNTKGAWQDVWLGIKVIAAEGANSVIDTAEGMINFIIDGVNQAIAAINKVIQLANKVPGVHISSIGSIASADFGRINTNTIAASDLAGRSNPVSTPNTTVQVSGNVLLDQNVATDIGDLMLKQLGLSNAL